MPFMEAVLLEDWEAVRRLYDDISSLESDADDLKRSIRMNLPRSLFLPFSRNNLLDMLHDLKDA